MELRAWANPSNALKMALSDVKMEIPEVILPAIAMASAITTI